MAGDDRYIRYLQGELGDETDDEIDPVDQRELDALLATLGDASTWDDPPAGLGDSIVAAIAAEAGASARPAVVREIGSRRPRRFAWIGPSAVAAAAAAVITFGITRIGDDGTTTRSADAIIQIAGTELQPGASGSAEVTSLQSGVRIDLNVPGLPRRDGDEFYEAWLKNVDGTLLVPIGTFHDADHVTLWAGVPIADFPILTVTQETVAGPKSPDQGSSGKVVVKGQLAP